jgi:uncharacterized protein
MEPLLVVLALLVMLVGMVGVVVPVLPGLLLVWLAGVSTTLWVGTDLAGWAVAVALTVLFLLGSAATVWLPAKQGRQGGASWASLAAAVLGALVGFVVIPVVGLLLGALAGLLVGEWRRLGDWSPAWSSTLQVLRAYGIGVIVELVLGTAMIGVWLVAALTRG